MIQRSDTTRTTLPPQWGQEWENRDYQYIKKLMEKHMTTKTIDEQVEEFIKLVSNHD